MLLLVLTAGIAAWCAHQYWQRLEEQDEAWQKRYRAWTLQGFFFPWLAWSFFNLGLFRAFPALVPQIVDAQQLGDPWISKWVTWSFIGGVFICIHWAAITYIWLLVRIVELAQDRKEAIFNIGAIGLLFGAIAGVIVYASGWMHTAAGICLALLPVVHFNIDLAEKPKPMATYSKAVAQVKRGKYRDAELEVINQLEKAETDFNGWMMLAELYATQYRNLEDAARVVLDITRHPESQPFQISVACHKLAEWQLSIGENPLAARAALELLCRKLPGTHFARMAEQQIRQIPKTFEEFDELKQPKRIRLPVLSEDLDAPKSAEPKSRSQAAAEANRLSEKLSEDPNDIATREKLAFVLAEKLGKLDLAIEQLQLLSSIPDTTPEQQSKWLAQVAGWEFNQTQDRAKFQGALRKIVLEYPQTTHAFAAQRRLYLLEMDFMERGIAG